MKMSHGVEFIAFWILTHLVQLLPAWLSDKLAVGLGRLAYSILTSRRRIAAENLDRAYKGALANDKIDSIVREVFKNIARTTIEFIRIPVVSSKKMLRYVYKQTGMEHIDQVLKEGRGCIFITGHVGSWEYLGGYLAASKIPTDFLVGQQHNKYVDDMFNKFRRSLGVGTIPVGVAARHVLKSLKANKLVALMSDQHSATGGVVVDFFDRPASTPKGSAAFAVKMKCPIIFGVMIRERYDRFHAEIYPPIYPPDIEDKEEAIKQMTQAYTSILEEVVRRYPEQWMWTHRRWKVT